MRFSGLCDFILVVNGRRGGFREKGQGSAFGKRVLGKRDGGSRYE